MTFFDYPGVDDEPSITTDYLLPDASQRDWDALLQVTVIRSLVAGETLIASGAADRSLYIVVDGALEVLLAGARGRWRQIARVNAGSVIGELSFFDGEARSALVRALTPVRVAELRPDEFADLAISRPDLALMVAMDLGRVLAQRLRRAQNSPAVAG
jgi:CRP/FNR family transcriptional regulator, cyclic AMP receptor protein